MIAFGCVWVGLRKNCVAYALLGNCYKTHIPKIIFRNLNKITCEDAGVVGLAVVSEREFALS